MCLIIQGNPKKFNREIISKAFIRNSDGFGLMYIDKKTKRIVTKKFYTKKINKILKTFKTHSKNCDQIALHFRITTNGNTNNKNCHPFQVLNADNDKIDVALMHNSPMLPAPLLSDQFSDSYYFSKIILRPILKNNFKLISNKSFLESLEKIIQAECDSRVLLLNTFNNEFIKLGTWHDHNGLSYSNDLIIPSKWEYKSYPRYTVQPSRPIYEDWDSSVLNDIDVNKVDAQDIVDFSQEILTLNQTELANLISKNSELISHYILATESGYDTSELKDVELYFQEEKKLSVIDDTKPLNKQSH
jgi:hypothetical protein